MGGPYFKGALFRKGNGVFSKKRGGERAFFSEIEQAHCTDVGGEEKNWFYLSKKEVGEQQGSDRPAPPRGGEGEGERITSDAQGKRGWTLPEKGGEGKSQQRPYTVARREEERRESYGRQGPDDDCEKARFVRR